MVNRALAVIALAMFCMTPASSASMAQVILLGTGTPGPDPERSGPATAIAIEDRAYLVDFGPGIVRRGSDVGSRGVLCVIHAYFKIAVLINLQSVHSVGLPTLISS